MLLTISASGLTHRGSIHAAVAGSGGRSAHGSRVSRPIPITHCMPFVEAGMIHPDVHVFHAVTTDTFIDKAAVVIPAKIVADHAMGIIFVHSFPANMVGPFPSAPAEDPLMKMRRVHKHKSVFTQSKVEIQSHPRAMINEGAINEDRSRWQRRPAHGPFEFVVTPKDPSRAPGIIRHPQPAVTRIAHPMPVMKGNIAPSIIGLPIQTIIGIHPLAIIIVRAPVRAGGEHRIGWFPDGSVAWEIDPGPPRSQLIMKILETDLRRRRRRSGLIRGSHRGLQRWRRGWRLGLRRIGSRGLRRRGNGWRSGSGGWGCGNGLLQGQDDRLRHPLMRQINDVVRA